MGNLHLHVIKVFEWEIVRNLQKWETIERKWQISEIIEDYHLDV